MTPREVIRRTVRFQGPDRLGHNFPDPYGSDFAYAGMDPSPDFRPTGGSGVDEWGAVWENIGVCQLGEVKQVPLPDWADWDQLNIPDVNAPHRWERMVGAREAVGEKFLLAGGISIYERVHFIRGLENTWEDIYQEPENLCRLIDLLTEMNLVAIGRYGEAGMDGFIFCDDWGLQDRLMIHPDKWREIWKPRYARIYAAAHEAGMLTFLHSCGHIVDILDDLIEVGLDVIHMDQQENMGLELLGERFGGRLTFYSPVDIQNTMARGDVGEVRTYCRKMARLLGRREGGFIPCWYSDPAGAGHTQEAVDAMCHEFLAISEETYGKK